MIEITYACAQCLRECVSGPPQPDDAPAPIQTTTNPERDGWALTAQGDMRFNPDGEPVYLCRYHALKFGILDQEPNMLVCSAGHRWETKHPFNRHLRPGMRCPMEMEYDRMTGTVRCRRILRAAKPGEYGNA